MSTIIFAFFCGILANGIALFSPISNYDCILFRRSSESLGQSLGQGRYILFIAQEFLNKYKLNLQIHNFNILISLVIISLSAILIVEIFKIQNKIFRYLFIAIFMTYVAITSMLIYNFAAILYSLSMIAAIYAINVWQNVCDTEKLFSSKNIFRMIAVVLLLTFSLGIYQAYILIPIAIVNILFINEMLTSDKTFIELVKKYATIVALIIISYIFNAILAKIFMSANGVDFHEGVSRGASGMGDVITNFSMSNLGLAYLKMITLWKYNYGYAGSINSNPLLHFVYLLSFIMSIVLFIALLIKSKSEMKKKILAILAFLFLPISFGFLEILFPNMVDSLQLQNITLMVALPIFFFEKLGTSLLTKISKYVIAFTAVLSTLTYAYFANLNLKDLYDMNKIMNSEMDMLINRITSCEGYEFSKPIIIVGNTPAIVRSIDRNNHMVYRGVNMNDFASSEDLEFMLSEYARFLFNRGTAAGKAIYAADERVKAMGTYPSADSIKAIDDYIIVKLGK